MSDCCQQAFVEGHSRGLRQHLRHCLEEEHGLKPHHEYVQPLLASLRTHRRVEFRSQDAAEVASAKAAASALEDKLAYVRDTELLIASKIGDLCSDCTARKVQSPARIPAPGAVAQAFAELYQRISVQNAF